MTSEQRVDPGRADDAAERKAIADVQQYGVHIIHVMGDDEGPCFSYTVGLWHTHRHPEILVIGLKDELCQSVLNDLNTGVSKSRQFRAGLSAEDVLSGFRVYFEALPNTAYGDYLGWDRWFYGGNEFEAVQMIWPNTEGVFPWQSAASEYLQWVEPVLTNIPVLVS